MSEPTTKNDLGERVWNFFASVKLSFFLLLILAITSILGTVLPQKEDPSAYVRGFGEAGSQLIFALRLNDMYHAPWFVMLLALLAVNLLICSLNRLPTTLKLMAKDPQQDAQRPNQAQETFTTPGDPATHAPQANALLAKAFGPVTQVSLDKGLALFAEKGNWSRLGVYVVHLSVLIIFVGAIVGNIWGFSGRLHLHEGDTAEAIELDGGAGHRPLGFALRLDKFKVSFYPDGMPSEYRSDVTFLDKGKEVMKVALMVNDPAEYQGVDFYQSTYGSEHLLQVDVKRGDKTEKVVLKTGAWSPLPGGGQAGVLDFRENVNMGARYQGPLARVLFQAGPEDEPQVIPAVKPGANLVQGGPVQFEIAGVQSIPYSGFSVKYDPGVWFIWVGCTLMVLGFIVTFYASHQKAWIRLVPDKNRTRWEIAGSANKNRLGLRRKLTRLAQAAQPQSQQGE